MGLLNWIAAGGIGLGIGYFKLEKLRKAADSLEVIARVRVHKLSSLGLELIADVSIKNPSDVDLEFSQPYIEIYYTDRKLGSSQVSDKMRKFKRKTTTPLPEPIKMTISYLNLLQFGWGAFQDFRAGKLTLKGKAVVTSKAKFFGFIEHIINKEYMFNLLNPNKQ